MRAPSKYRLAAVVAFAVTAAGCSTSSGGDLGAPPDVVSSRAEAAATTVATPDATDAPADDSAPSEPPADSAPAGPNEIPDVTVLDVATGEEVALASLAPADKPIILWMWAPH